MNYSGNARGRQYAREAGWHTHFECSVLVAAYMKYCDKNGIENEFSKSRNPVSLQDELFPWQVMPEKRTEA